MDGFVFGIPEPTPEQQAEFAEKQKILDGKVHAEMSSMINLFRRLDEQEMATLRGLIQNAMHDHATGHYIVGIIDATQNTLHNRCLVSGCDEHHLDPDQFLAEGGTTSD